MGVDRYMEEILRVVDQREITDGKFASFISALSRLQNRFPYETRFQSLLLEP
jgi:hypothetical protein